MSSREPSDAASVATVRIVEVPRALSAGARDQAQRALLFELRSELVELARRHRGNVRGPGAQEQARAHH